MTVAVQAAPATSREEDPNMGRPSDRRRSARRPGKRERARRKKARRGSWTVWSHEVRRHVPGAAALTLKAGRKKLGEAWRGRRSPFAWGHDPCCPICRGTVNPESRGQWTGRAGLTVHWDRRHSGAEA